MTDKYPTEKQEAKNYAMLTVFALFVLLPILSIYWLVTHFFDIFKVIEIKTSKVGDNS